MPRKSSKTAHVLNLLTGTKDNDTPAAEQASEDNAEKDTFSGADTEVPEKSRKRASSDTSSKAEAPKKSSAAKKKNVPEQKPKKVSKPELDSIEVQHTAVSEMPVYNEGDTELDADDVNAVKEEISAEIIDDIHISKPVAEMAENVAEILLDTADTDTEEKTDELVQVDAARERIRTINSSQSLPFSDIPAAENNISDMQYPSGPFSYNAIQSEPEASPMPKSAVASMLIAERKEAEKEAQKEAENVARSKEISSDTPVYENADMTLVNLTEKAASKRIPDIMKKFNMCTCERCYFDVLALTLNSVPQKTVIIPKDDIDSKIKEYELDATVDLVTAISKSCVHVKISPRH